jgi:type I restriction enzyme S subunit
MGKQKLDSIAIGSTQKALTIDSLKKVNIPLPIHDNKLVSRFNEIINPIFNEIYILNEETKNLRQIRDSLIPKLMSGKINLNIQQEALAK